MAGRVKRGRGRLMESVGALTGNNRLKDKGRLLRGEGRVKRLLGKVRGK